jgi:hypothetical protein
VGIQAKPDSLHQSGHQHQEGDCSGDGEDAAWDAEVARLNALDIAAWQEEVARLPSFEHPGRRYILGRGPIGVACDLDRQPLAPVTRPVSRRGTAVLAMVTTRLWVGQTPTAKPTPHHLQLRPDPTADTCGVPRTTQGVRLVCRRTKRAEPNDLIQHPKMTCGK